jgi:hypothetical protein
LYRAVIFFFCFLFLAVRPVVGQQAEPLFGIWRLNLAESQFASGPPAYSRVTCKIQQLKDGMKVVYDMVGIRAV